MTMSVDAERDHVAAAIDLARRLLVEAEPHSTPATRHQAARLARLVDDPAAKAFVLAMTDEVVRIRDPRRAAQRLHDLVSGHPLPHGIGPIDRVQLRVGSRLARTAPRLVMPLVVARLRRESSSMVLPAEHDALTGELARRSQPGVRLNINLLGEAILGDREAEHRLQAVLDQISRDDVTDVSVKISSLCAQLNVLAFDHEVDRISAQLARVYDAASRRTPAVFVHLDMEEYRDLHLTASAMMHTLDQPEFAALDAGIALQAYLPDSMAVLRYLCEWAVERQQRGGGQLRVRLVKGANLAMERVEAELHGWAQAPFETKAEVDANYKAMLDHVLDDRFGDAVRVGVASHNLFDLAWALTRRAELDDPTRLEIEMLEGMADAEARAVRDTDSGLLLYAPIVRRDDFEAAIAYLVRRLDENSAPENFLRSLLTMTPNSRAFDEQQERFEAAVEERFSVNDRPRRTQDRSFEKRRFDPDGPFENEPDTDFSLAANREWIERHITAALAPRPHTQPDAHSQPVAESVAGATTSGAGSSASGAHDRGEDVIDVAAIDAAVALAWHGAREWSRRSREDRRTVLHRVAEVLAERRGDLVAAMVHDTAKTVLEGDPEVSEAIDFARYYAGSTHTLDRLEQEGLRFDPYRVVVVAAPWNFPLAIPAGGVLAALAAGAAVILKPAPESRSIAGLLAEACWQAGVPRDALQHVPSPDGDVGRHLITHPDVDAVVLTGAYDTARQFLDWKPSMRLHAETSGKNALVITATADLDLAVRDLVRSAFGHAGQKCSAASLAIVEASVYDDPRFQDKLRDAVRSLVVGPARDPATMVAPLIRAADGDLRRALTTLDPGERWLVEPRQDPADECLWHPGVKLDVAPGSFFHHTECFGPVLGLMRANDLDHAIHLQNAPAFGLTGGIHALDPHEIEQWLEEAEVGNAYVNRAITGAIVQRQPFGGWKRSSVGPGTKAGGPNYVLSFGRWHDTEVVADPQSAAAFSFRRAWVEHFNVEHDPSALTSERNALRYRRPPRGVVLRLGSDADETAARLALAAAKVTGTVVRVSAATSMARLGVDVVVEDDHQFADRLAAIAADRVRLLGTADDEIYRAAHRANLPVDDHPVVRHGRIELLRWLREQAISETRHRYGNPMPDR
jgi:RHH-type proline utilization regulon transcriptional repressor/proline dehydrogenase/delta 1-pyrroline-5-carboxylate dehydrogenase